MSQWIKQTQLIKQLAQNLLTPRQSNYRDDYLIYKMSKTKHLLHKNFKIPNQYNQLLHGTVINNKNEHNQVCIIFLHGYGSNKLQGLTLIELIPKDLDFCCFDFSASGRSQGNTTIFGIKQYRDLCAVINHLKSQAFSYKKFILWGRSMGAVASLLLTSSLLAQDKVIQKDIIFQVLDSPFSTFESICYYQAKQMLKLPQAFINYGIWILKQHFKSHPFCFNPFNINLINSSSSCFISSLFVYSQNDSIIPSSNTLQIIGNLPKQTYFQKLLIDENHNSSRKIQTNQDIFIIIRKNYIKYLYAKNAMYSSKDKFHQIKPKTFLILSVILKKTLGEHNVSNTLTMPCSNMVSETSIAQLPMSKQGTQNLLTKNTYKQQQKQYSKLLQSKSKRAITVHNSRGSKLKKRALYCSLGKQTSNISSKFTTQQGIQRMGLRRNSLFSILDQQIQNNQQ